MWIAVRFYEWKIKEGTKGKGSSVLWPEMLTFAEKQRVLTNTWKKLAFDLVRTLFLKYNIFEHWGLSLITTRTCITTNYWQQDTQFFAEAFMSLFLAMWHSEFCILMAKPRKTERNRFRDHAIMNRKHLKIQANIPGYSVQFVSRCYLVFGNVAYKVKLFSEKRYIATLQYGSLSVCGVRVCVSKTRRTELLYKLKKLWHLRIESALEKKMKPLCFKHGCPQKKHTHTHLYKHENACTLSDRWCKSYQIYTLWKFWYTCLFDSSVNVMVQLQFCRHLQWFLTLFPWTPLCTYTSPQPSLSLSGMRAQVKNRNIWEFSAREEYKCA